MNKMYNPNDKMTKAQKHVINKRIKEYGKDELKEFISKKYSIENVDLNELTKLQAQDVIISFKPHKKPTTESK